MPALCSAEDQTGLRPVHSAAPPFLRFGQYILDKFLCAAEEKIVYSEAVKWNCLAMLLRSICSSVQFKSVLFSFTRI